LADFPERGTLHPALGADVRLVGHKRRATIVFRVRADERRVVVVAVLYRGRDVRAALEERGQ